MIFRCDLVPQYRKYERGIQRAIARVLASGRYVLGDEVKAFEAEFAAYIGMRHGIGVANATDGLTLALRALGIGRGDEVITTPFTAIPTASAIVDAGATPVFVDVKADTYLMDIEQVPRAVTKRTRAIMPVHIFGNVVDVPRLRKLTGGRLAIIEDAAQAHGSALRGRKAGSFGDMSVFSFYPTKNLGGYGDGGIVLTGNRRTEKALRRLRMYGMSDKDHTVGEGVNSRLDELQAAVLRVKLPELDKMNRRRNSIAARYRRGLRHDLFDHQVVAPGIYSNFHVFVSRLKGNPARFMRYMDSKKIQVNVYYSLPMHLQKSLRDLGYRPGAFPVVERLCRSVVALPLYPEFDSRRQNRVVSVINAFA